MRAYNYSDQHREANLCPNLHNRTRQLANALSVPEIGLGTTTWRNRVTARTQAIGSAEDQDQDGFLQRLGPGLITGASDDDPSGIGTYSQAGAQLGFGNGWADQAGVALPSSRVRKTPTPQPSRLATGRVRKSYELKSGDHLCPRPVRNQPSDQPLLPRRRSEGASQPVDRRSSRSSCHLRKLYRDLPTRPPSNGKALGWTESLRAGHETNTPS